MLSLCDANNRQIIPTLNWTVAKSKVAKPFNCLKGCLHHAWCMVHFYVEEYHYAGLKNTREMINTWKSTFSELKKKSCYVNKR